MAAAPARAADDLAPIGYVWLQTLVPSSLVGEDKGNVLFLVGGQGDLEWRGSDVVRPSLFAEAYYSRDTKSIDWNNEFVAGAGAQVRITPASGMQFIAGAEYQRDRRPISGRTRWGPQGFAGWDIRWPPNAGRVEAIRQGKRFTVITQGDLRYPSCLREEDHGSGLGVGSVNIAYDLLANPRLGLALAAVQATVIKVDTKRIDHYNLISPSFGIEGRYFLTPTTAFNIGVRFQSETRFVSGRTRTGPAVYVGLVTWRW